MAEPDQSFRSNVERALRRTSWAISGTGVAGAILGLVLIVAGLMAPGKTNEGLYVGGGMGLFFLLAGLGLYWAGQARKKNTLHALFEDPASIVKVEYIVIRRRNIYMEAIWFYTRGGKRLGLPTGNPADTQRVFQELQARLPHAQFEGPLQR